jgi:cytochrome c553
MSHSRFLLAAAMACLACTAGAQQGDAAAGKAKTYQCEGCHGIPEWKTAFPEIYRVPKLGGQHPAYIVSALKAYKSGERNFPTMTAIAADLSDKDMADIAAYYGATAAKSVEAKK